MTLTMADHARAYRQRKAKKLERLAVCEAALKRIANPTWASGQWQDVASEMQMIARQALAPTTSQERVR